MVKRTQKNILDAFNRLIPKYTFEKMTVDMICREADVSHATFYRYFRDKFDVMNLNYKNLLDSYIHDERCKNYQELYFYLYKTARQSWQFLQHAFGTTGINSFGYYIFKYSHDMVCQITAQNRKSTPESCLTPQEALQLDVFCYGISHMYEKWTMGGFDLSAKAAADALFEIMPPSLKNYWWVG